MGASSNLKITVKIAGNEWSWNKNHNKWQSVLGSQQLKQWVNAKKKHERTNERRQQWKAKIATKPTETEEKKMCTIAVDCNLYATWKTFDLWRSIVFGFAHNIYVNQSLSVSLVIFTYGLLARRTYLCVWVCALFVHSIWGQCTLTNDSVCRSFVFFNLLSITHQSLNLAIWSFETEIEAKEGMKQQNHR